MKYFYTLFTLVVIINAYGFSQNIGIGISNPPELFSVNGTALIDAGNQNNGTSVKGYALKFGTTGGVSIGSNKISGASTNGLEFFTKSYRRMVIDSVGNIGLNADPLPDFRLTVNGNIYTPGIAVGTVLPDLGSYRIDIAGNSRVRQDSYVNKDLWVDRNFDVDGASSFAGDIGTGGNLSVAKNVTVNGGKGLIRSATGTQQIITYPSGAVTFTNASAGASVDVDFILPDVFASAPRVAIAQLTNQSGSFERWTYTVHSIDIVAHKFVVRFFNTANTASTMTATLNFIAVGPAL